MVSLSLFCKWENRLFEVRWHAQVNHIEGSRCKPSRHTAIECTRAGASPQKAKGRGWHDLHPRPVSNKGSLTRMTTKTHPGPEGTHPSSSIHLSISGASQGDRSSARSPSFTQSWHCREVSTTKAGALEGKQSIQSAENPPSKAKNPHI